MAALSMSLGPTDPEEIIDFLLQETPEPYPFARLIALLTLCAWMRWPDDQDVVLDAQTTAAATVFLHEREKGNAPSIPLTLGRLCDSVVDRKVTGQYWEAFEEQLGVTDIVSFFMHCPEERKPSLGKAYYFIEKGGFLPDDLNDEETKEFSRGARSSLKAAWKEQARSGPLLYAAETFDEDLDLYWCSPDDDTYLEDATSLTYHKIRLMTFFGVALFCQQKLVRLLDKAAAAQIRFPKFPESVTPVDPGWGTFDEDQLRILDKYAAPQ
jgi:hypothetical protein